MVSEILEDISNFNSEICKFYTGKTIFITGASGFLGTVILETLLRCCPGIHRIYILVRSKKNILPDDRKNFIFKKHIFNKLKECNPDVLKKVIAVSGDISERNLGMNENDMNKLTEEISVVFHVAATISFIKPLSFIIRQNVIATNTVIDFCRRLRKLEVLVYTSSAFSNCNQKDVIEERIYDLPFSVEKILKFGRNDDEEELMKLYRMCDPPFPNFYTFSKCVAENLLKEKAYDLPVTIIRPSIIFSCIKGPLPGYVEEGSAIINLAVAAGKGFLRVVPADASKRIELIPADVVANTHIVAASHQASKSLFSPSIYNCVSGELVKFTWKDLIDNLQEMVRRKPLPESYMYPLIILCKNPILYSFWTFFLHWIPAVVIDLLLLISGNKQRALKLYGFYQKSMESVEFFVMNDWDMRNQNFQSLSKTLNAFEEKVFSMSLQDYTWDVMKRTLPTGCDIYLRNGKPYKEHFKIKILRFFLSSLILLIILGNVALILYLVFKILF